MLRWKASTTYSGQADVMFAGAAIKGLGKVGNFGPSALFAGAVFDMDRFVVVTNFSLRGLVEMCFPIARQFKGRSDAARVRGIGTSAERCFSKTKETIPNLSTQANLSPDADIIHEVAVAVQHIE